MMPYGIIRTAFLAVLVRLADEIDVGVIYDTVIVDLPELLKDIEKVL